MCLRQSKASRILKWQLLKICSQVKQRLYLHSAVVDVTAPVKGDCADVLFETELSYPLSYKLSGSLQCSTAGRSLPALAYWCRQAMHSAKLFAKEYQVLAESGELD